MIRYLMVSASLLVALISGSSWSTVMEGEAWFFSTPNCRYCEAFRREVVPGYSNTSVGKRLPLRVIPHGGSQELDVGGVYFYPTVVVVDPEGGELFRIQGYSSSESFWMQMEVGVARHLGGDSPALH